MNQYEVTIETPDYTGTFQVDADDQDTAEDRAIALWEDETGLTKAGQVEFNWTTVRVA